MADSRNDCRIRHPPFSVGSTKHVGVSSTKTCFQDLFAVSVAASVASTVRAFDGREGPSRHPSLYNDLCYSFHRPGGPLQIGNGSHFFTSIACSQRSSWEYYRSSWLYKRQKMLLCFCISQILISTSHFEGSDKHARPHGRVGRGRGGNRCAETPATLGDDRRDTHDSNCAQVCHEEPDNTTLLVAYSEAMGGDPLLLCYKKNYINFMFKIFHGFFEIVWPP